MSEVGHIIYLGKIDHWTRFYFLQFITCVLHFIGQESRGHPRVILAIVYSLTSRSVNKLTLRIRYVVTSLSDVMFERSNGFNKAATVTGMFTKR